jgi:hypothetical protein
MRTPLGTPTDYSHGLPTIDGMTLRSRTAAFVPAPFDFRDPTAGSHESQTLT